MEVWVCFQNRYKLCNTLFQLVKDWSCSFPGMHEALMCLQLAFVSSCLKSAGNHLLHSFGKLLSTKQREEQLILLLQQEYLIYWAYACQQFQLICHNQRVLWPPLCSIVHASIVEWLLISPLFRQWSNAVSQRWGKEWVIEAVMCEGC